MYSYLKYSDDKLLTLIKESDEYAFTEFYHRNWQKMFSAAYKRLQNIDQSKDVIQNVFTDLWERRTSLSILNIQAYLFSAVRYQVYKVADRKNEKIHFLDSFDHIIASSQCADSQLLEEETLGLLNLWVDALPERRKVIFQLYYFENLTTAEIASRLDISQKTVQNQLLLATDLIRSNLNQTLFTIFLLVYIQTC